MKENRLKGQFSIPDVNSAASTARSVCGFIKLSPRKDWKKKKSLNASAEKQKQKLSEYNIKSIQKDNSSSKSEKKLSLSKNLMESDKNKYKTIPKTHTFIPLPKPISHSTVHTKQFSQISTFSDPPHPYQNRTLKFKSNFIKQLQQASTIGAYTTFVNKSAGGNPYELNKLCSPTLRKTDSIFNDSPSPSSNPSYLFCPSPCISSNDNQSGFSTFTHAAFTPYAFSSLSQINRTQENQPPLQMRSTITLNEARVVETVESDGEYDTQERSIVVDYD